MFFKQKMLLLALLIALPFHTFALTERHLIIICHGDEKGRLLEKTENPGTVNEQNVLYAKQIANLLITYGFDNRSIAAVFVPPNKNTRHVAEKIAEIGLFTKNKIHADKRLSDKNTSFFKNNKKNENPVKLSNAEVRKKVLEIYDEAESQYPTGHVLFLTPGLPAMELIDGVIHSKIQLRTAQAYMLPLVKREMT